MTIHVYCLLAMLMAGPGAETMDVQAGALDLAQPDPLISSRVALADVNRVCVCLVTHSTDAPFSEDLAAQVAETLKAKGIECVERRTEVTPRLRIQIETVSVKDSGHTVYRIQTVLSRIVTLAGKRPCKSCKP